MNDPRPSCKRWAQKRKKGLKDDSAWLSEKWKNKSSHEKTASLATHTHNGVTTFDINCCCFCNFLLVLLTLTWTMIINEIISTNSHTFFDEFPVKTVLFQWTVEIFHLIRQFSIEMTSLLELYITTRRFFCAQWFHETFLQNSKVQTFQLSVAVMNLWRNTRCWSEFKA